MIDVRPAPQPLTDAQIRLLITEAIEARRKGKEVRVFWCDERMYVVPIEVGPKKAA